jgi:hypothetical protein
MARWSGVKGIDTLQITHILSDGDQDKLIAYLTGNNGRILLVTFCHNPPISWREIIKSHYSYTIGSLLEAGLRFVGIW